MFNAVQAVIEFHQKMHQIVGDPISPDVSINTQLRVDLIQEEFDELKLALSGKDKHGNQLTSAQQIVAVADALGDLSYVTTGAAVAWGIELGCVFEAIHASNMTKSPHNTRFDGKILKGPEYQPPRIPEALAEAAEALERDGYGEDSWWPEPSLPLSHEESSQEDPAKNHLA